MMITQIKADLKKRCMEKQGRLIGPEDDAENELIYTYLNDKGIVKTSENFQNAFKGSIFGYNCTNYKSNLRHTLIKPKSLIFSDLQWHVWSRIFILSGTKLI